MSETRQYTIEDIPQMLAELSQERFYGALELKFENGHLVVIKKTQTLRAFPVSHRENRGSSNETRR